MGREELKRNDGGLICDTGRLVDMLRLFVLMAVPSLSVFHISEHKSSWTVEHAWDEEILHGPHAGTT